MDYYFSDMLGEDTQSPGVDTIAVNKSNAALLADPIVFKFRDVRNKSNQQITTEFKTLCTPHHTHGSRLLSLPCEILESVVCCLDFQDARNLVVASILPSGEDGITLPRVYWQSRFFGSGETAFARSIRPSSYTWKDWFFQLRLEMESGPNKNGLRNRQRIWKLGVQLGTMAHTVNDSHRTLCGEITRSELIEAPCSMSGVALQRDAHGCQELKQVCVHLNERTSVSRVCSVEPTHVIVANRRLISGLTFTFNDGRSMDAGYVISRGNAYANLGSSPEYLWLVFSTLGLEAISLREYPQHYINQRFSSDKHDFAVTRWPVHCISAFYLGLDVCLLSASILRIYLIISVTGFAHCEDLC